MATFTVRAATESDYPAFARLFPELAVPDPLPSRDYFVATVVPGAIFLCDGVVPLGYAWGRARGGSFHVVHIIVDPARRREGAGCALMGALASRARKEGFHRWVLSVKPENTAAQALYCGWGMAVTSEGVSMSIRWADVARLPQGEEAVVTRRIAPEYEARYEEALGASRGELASFRALGRILAGVERADRSALPLGFVAFDPPLPGASPFRVSAPAFARPLLESVRPLALPALDHVRLSVEADPALEAILTEAGARPVMRALRMEGEVPTLHSS